MPGLILLSLMESFSQETERVRSNKWNGKSRKRTETWDPGNSQCKKKRKAKLSIRVMAEAALRQQLCSKSR